MNPRQLLNATLIIIGLLTALTIPASAAAVTYTLDAANATNVTLQNGIWIPASGAASITIPLRISTTDYVYGYTAQNTTASPTITYQDKTAWVSEQNAGKLSAGICAGPGGTEITGTGKLLANITISTSGMTAGTYSTGIHLESAYSDKPLAAVSLPALNKETYTQTFTIRIGNPAPVPTHHSGGGGGIHVLTPTPVLPPTPTPGPTPENPVHDSGENPTPENPVHDSGKDQPDAAVPIPIALLTGGIVVLIGCILLFPILFPRVTLNYNGQTTRFRTRIGKSIKGAIAKHAPDLPVDGWYSNKAKTEPRNPDARIWHKLQLWHQR